MLRGEVKITPNDVLAFEDRANKLQYEAGLARMQANTVNELHKQQGEGYDDNFCNKENYTNDIKDPLKVIF